MTRNLLKKGAVCVLGMEKQLIPLGSDPHLTLHNAVFRYFGAAGSDLTYR